MCDFSMALKTAIQTTHQSLTSQFENAIFKRLKKSSKSSRRGGTGNRKAVDRKARSASGLPFATYACLGETIL